MRGLVRTSSAPSVRDRLASMGVSLVEGDVRDESSLVSAARGVDVVVHTVALRPRGGTLAEHEQVNLIGTENALAASRAVGVRRFVFLSTEAVTAGNFHRNYVDERLPHADRFLSPYAETMALAEALVLATNGIAGLETVALRPGWVWGPGDNMNLPDWIQRARTGTLWLIDGGSVFVPTTYVSNLADAIVLAATVPSVAGNVYYITDDERITCREFFTRVMRAVGLPPPRRRCPYALAYAWGWLLEKTRAVPAMTRADVVALGRHALFNLTRARTELGYAPAVGVAEGMKKLAAWVAEVGGADAIVRGDVQNPTAEDVSSGQSHG